MLQRLRRFPIPIPADLDQASLLAALDRVPDLKQVRVVYFDGSQVFEIRAGSRTKGSGARVVVVYAFGDAVAPEYFGLSPQRESRLAAEVVGGVLSCSAAVIGWLVVFGSAGAAPVTGGSSAIITGLAWTASTASTAQCLNSAGRITAEVTSPESLDWIDDQGWYTATSDALDVLSLAGATTAGLATLRMVKIARAANPGKTTLSVLKGLQRHERKRLTEEIIRAQNPGLSNSQLKQLIRAGTYPKRYTAQAISGGMKQQLLDALGATFSFAGSASAGVTRKFVVGVAEALED